METVREFFDSIRKHLRDRLANPLYTAYLVSWAVLNFRLILVLFGEGSLIQFRFDPEPREMSWFKGWSKG